MVAAMNAYNMVLTAELKNKIADYVSFHYLHISSGFCGNFQEFASY